MGYSQWRQFAPAIAVAVLFGSLTGCGFSPRNDYQLKQQLQLLQLASSTRHDPLQRTLAQRLSFLEVGVVQDPSSFVQQTATLILQPEKLERKLLSLFPTGQVAEYELLYHVSYSYHAAGTPEPVSLGFTLSREYQDDPDQILAKSRELDLILNELRQQAAQRIIRGLNAATSAPGSR